MQPRRERDVPGKASQKLLDALALLRLGNSLVIAYGGDLSKVIALGLEAPVPVLLAKDTFDLDHILVAGAGHCPAKAVCTGDLTDGRRGQLTQCQVAHQPLRV